MSPEGGVSFLVEAEFNLPHALCGFIIGLSLPLQDQLYVIGEPPFL